MTPSNFFIFLKGNLLRISSVLEVIIGYFCFTELDVLELYRVNLSKFGVLEFSRIVRILFSCVLARLEFSVLVIFVSRLSSKFPCLFLFLFYFILFYFMLFYRGSCAF